MNNHAHDHHSALGRAPDSLNRLAFSATVHCLTGCSIGEVLGMVIGTALGMSNAATIGLAVVLAFISGYLMTLLPLRQAVRTALAADTVSIAIMELVDNLIMLAIPARWMRRSARRCSGAAWPWPSRLPASRLIP